MTSPAVPPTPAWNVPLEAAGILRTRDREDLARVVLAAFTPAPIGEPGPGLWPTLFAFLAVCAEETPDLDNVEAWEAALAEDCAEDEAGQTILAALRLSAMGGAVYVLRDDASALRLARSASAALLALHLADPVLCANIRDVAALVQATGTTRVTYSAEHPEGVPDGS